MNPMGMVGGGGGEGARARETLYFHTLIWCCFLFITQNVIYNFAMNTLYLSFCVDSLPKTTGV